MIGNRKEEKINGCKVVLKQQANGNHHIYLLQPDGSVIGQILRDRIKSELLFSDYCTRAMNHVFVRQNTTKCNGNPLAFRKVQMTLIPQF